MIEEFLKENTWAVLRMGDRGLMWNSCTNEWMVKQVGGHGLYWGINITEALRILKGV